jgi:methionyl-tRNA formyltransferase
VHGSLLPKYRWASPLQSVFLSKDEISWITIMHMDEGMDTWNIIDKLAFKIPFEWTVKDLIECFKEKGPEFLNDTLWDYW